ncbi:hypothetical protein [Azohydromonas aeria]|uniref:hypothetical protein n=1 Tax=Azohydromonas aeria TaxID=2590212 RepID=UPI0012F7E37A|nr:hypothetical protein [Azohydromonas aeria]
MSPSRRVACAVFCGVLMSAHDAIGQLPPGVSTSDVAAAQLPRPSVVPGELPRPCPPDAARRYGAPVADLRFASEDVRAALEPFARLTLLAWARKNFGYRNDACMEMDYIVRKFQAATGSDVTGALSAADVQRLAHSLQAGRQGIRREAADMPRGAVDFMPRGTSDLRLGCTSRMHTAAAQLRQTVLERVMALPPSMRRSGVTEAVERDVKAQLLAVAPQWADLWQRQPLMQEWARRNDCNSDLRFMVEHWQIALGLAPNALDTQAIPRTLEVVEQAETQARQYTGEQNRRFAAEAVSSGEAAKARVWSLDELSGRTQLRSVLAQMPAAFCGAQGSVVTCRKVGACDAESAELHTAEAAARWTRLAANPLDLRVTPGRGEAGMRVQAAQAALARCEAKSPYSAAAQSRIRFAGLDVSSVRLHFNTAGLTTATFEINGDAEPARAHLTRIYGRHETQQEVRTRPRVVLLPGPAPADGSGPAQMQPDVIPENYSVTRYIWNGPKVRIEESSGTFEMRFSE